MRYALPFIVRTLSIGLIPGVTSLHILVLGWRIIAFENAGKYGAALFPCVHPIMTLRERPGDSQFETCAYRFIFVLLDDPYHLAGNQGKGKLIRTRGPRPA